MSKDYFELKTELTGEILKLKFESNGVDYQARNLNFIALAERDIIPLAQNYSAKKVSINFKIWNYNTNTDKLITEIEPYIGENLIWEKIIWSKMK